MKIWSSEHTFSDPWELVVRAQWRKYPNKYNQAVEGVDVVERNVDKNGVLHSHRLMSTRWGFPDWATKILGGDGLGYGSEHSAVDAKNKSMEMKTRNLSFCNVITIDEKMVYTPHPADKTKTMLKQETVVTVKGVPLSSYIEHYVAQSIGNNAANGRKAMQYVIDKIKTETTELQQGAMHTVHTVEEAFKHVHLPDSAL